MGADRNYLAVKLIEGGDRTAVIAAVEHDSHMKYDTVHNGTLVFDGIGSLHVIERIKLVPEHIDHAVLVHFADTAGYNSGYYFEGNGDTLVEIETVSSKIAGSLIFDYFSREYGVYGAL